MYVSDALCQSVSAHGVQCIIFSGKATLAGGHFLLSSLDVKEIWLGWPRVVAFSKLTLRLLARI